MVADLAARHRMRGTARATLLVSPPCSSKNLELCVGAGDSLQS